MKYEKQILDGSSILYIKQVLTNGNTIPRRLAQMRNLDAGSVFAFLPAGRTGLGIEDYTHANDTERLQSLNYLIGFIKGTLKNNDDSIFLFENRYAQRSDPVTLRFRSQMVFFQEEVYHVIQDKEISDDPIKTAITEADSSMLLVGVCFRAFDAPLWKSKSEISFPEIDLLVTKSIYIVVEAFDGGGFLFWS